MPPDFPLSPHHPAPDDLRNHTTRPPGRQAPPPGLVKGEVGYTPHEEVVGKTKALDPELIELARVLAE